MKLIEQKDQLRRDVAELMRQCSHWQMERDVYIEQIKEATTPGIIGIVQRIVCTEYNISRRDLLSQRRLQGLTRPRHIAIWLCRKCSLRSMPEIGRLFAGRDHTTILHAVRKIESMRTADPDFATLLDRLKARVEVEIAAVRARNLTIAEKLNHAANQDQDQNMV